MYIYAQTNKTFEARLLLGFNASQIDGDLMGGFNKLGLRTGVSIFRKMNKNWSYTIEMAYSQKGSKRIYNEFGPIGGIWDKAKADYIEVPILVGYEIPKRKITVHAGLACGTIIRRYVYDNVYGESPSDFFRKLESSYMIGITYPMNEKWLAGARYQSSILSVAKSGIPILNVYTNYMSHVLVNVSLAYRLQ